MKAIARPLRTTWPVITALLFLIVGQAVPGHAQSKLNISGVYQLNKKSWSYSCTASDAAAGPYDVIISDKKGKPVASGTIKHLGGDKLVLALNHLKSMKTGSYQFAYHPDSKPRTFFDAQTSLKAEVDDLNDALTLILHAAIDTYLNELKK